MHALGADALAAIRPTLLHVSRTHVVTISGGLLFDVNEPTPLSLTSENLDRCIGAPYSGDVVRGYTFHMLEPSKKALKRVSLCDENDSCNSPMGKRMFNGMGSSRTLSGLAVKRMHAPSWEMSVLRN